MRITCKTIIKYLFILFCVSILLLLGFYNVRGKRPPSFDTLAVIDIYNSTDETVDDVKITCNKERESESYNITIPAIQVGQRIIVVFSTALYGNYDTAVYINYNNNEQAVASLEKGYFGLYTPVKLNEIGIQSFRYGVPWIPKWDGIYYYNNLGDMMSFETRQNYMDRMGFKTDPEKRIDLIADETLMDLNIRKMKEYYELLNIYK